MNNVTNKYVIVLTYNIDVLRFMRRIELLTMFDNRENEDFYLEIVEDMLEVRSQESD